MLEDFTDNHDQDNETTPAQWRTIIMILCGALLLSMTGILLVVYKEHEEVTVRTHGTITVMQDSSKSGTIEVDLLNVESGFDTTADSNILYKDAPKGQENDYVVIRGAVNSGCTIDQSKGWVSEEPSNISSHVTMDINIDGTPHLSVSDNGGSNHLLGHFIYQCKG